MAYRSVPCSETPTISGSGGTIRIHSNNAPQSCPNAVDRYLRKLGWRLVSEHTDTHSSLYQKNDMGYENGNRVNLTDYLYYPWYEAVAYEQAKFMMIGLGD